jgi:replicative DNA helicase
VDKRPILSDLCESGSIEQDAETVRLLREDLHNHEDLSVSGRGELIIAKARIVRWGLFIPTTG